MENIDPLVKKREKRAVNFTPSEVRVLMDMVYKFKEIIENKKTDTETNKVKEAAWAKIAVLFNATSGVVVRSSKTLKLKYESIKKNTKKKTAQNRQEIYKTGGGEPTNIVFTPAEEKVLAMCSNINGLETRNDSDTVIIKASTSTLSITDVVGAASDDINLEDDGIEYLLETEPKALDINEGDWQAWTPQSLKTKISPALRKKPTKASVRSKFDELGEARLEVVQLQKQIAEAELKYKQIEHEQKTEEHQIRILHLNNEENRRQEEHSFKMEKFMK